MTNEKGIGPLGQKTFLGLKHCCDAVMFYLVRLGYVTVT